MGKQKITSKIKCWETKEAQMLKISTITDRLMEAINSFLQVQVGIMKGLPLLLRPRKGLK